MDEPGQRLGGMFAVAEQAVAAGGCEFGLFGFTGLFGVRRQALGASERRRCLAVPAPSVLGLRGRSLALDTESIALGRKPCHAVLEFGVQFRAGMRHRFAQWGLLASPTGQKLFGLAAFASRGPPSRGAREPPSRHPPRVGRPQPPRSWWSPMRIPSAVSLASATRCLRSPILPTRSDALSALLTQGGIAVAAVGMAATLLAWLVAGRMLQPLQRMTDTARRIAEAPAADRNLHERIALAGPEDELKRLADTFDLMLERLDHSFDGQRRFIANASHELRTPLALNQALLEVAVYRRDASDDVRHLGETLLEINSRHERLFDGLLLLARSEHDVVDRSLVDLADIVEHFASQVPSEGSVKVEAAAEEAATTGNPVLLERTTSWRTGSGTTCPTAGCG
ncbi:HAMP domain-containing protein [Embleya sp. NPDC020630]|uniref:HAMP domain-containing protein n=1 Tax=Embleya sp. NPDC020630 TaxID=3363979 RepID=UPI0037BA9EE7